VSGHIDRCELTHAERQAIDVGVARAQHRRYEAALARLGCVVRRAADRPDLPDGVFVEDTAVVFDTIAVIARPGAESRRAETVSIAESLRPYRRLHFVSAPATLDGGDVLQIGMRVYVGLSRRSNPAGVRQLDGVLTPLGFKVTAVAIRGCLHLKSAVTRVAADTVLVNPGWVDPACFGGATTIDVHPMEPHAANALLVGNRVVYPAGYPRTQERLERSGVLLEIVELSELAKAEGAVTCCSLIFDA
jgi:dimethylargininase